MRYLILLSVVLLAGCPKSQTIKPTIPTPEVVTVTKTVQAKVPTWATEPLKHTPRTNDTVRAHLEHEDSDHRMTEVYECHRKLLRRLDAGEKVDPKECSK